MSLRFLHLEDSQPDAELVLLTLQEAGIACTSLRVDTKADFVEALDGGGFDLIVSDLTMPAFDGLSALALARQKRPDIPFIFVSGTLGEEAAISSLLNGATDYVLKHRFSRLIPAVQRAVAEARERRLRLETGRQLSIASDRLRNLFENLDDVFVSVNVIDREQSQVSPACERISGWRAADFIQNPQLLMECVHEEDRRRVIEALSGAMQGKAVRDECRILTRKRAIRWLEFQLKPVFENKEVSRIDGVIRDVTEKRVLEKQLLRSNSPQSIAPLPGDIQQRVDNLLTPTLTAIQLLRDRTNDERSLEILNALELNVKQVLASAEADAIEPSATIEKSSAGKALSKPKLLSVGGQLRAGKGKPTT